jgi:hypothetical protein
MTPDTTAQTRKSETAPEDESRSSTDPEAPMLLALLDNEIDEATYQARLALPIKLDDMEQTHHYNEWRTYRERTSRLEKQ